jgi:hypothetical protein
VRIYPTKLGLFALAGSITLGAACGCNRDEPVVAYTAPKDPPAPVVSASASAPAGAASTPAEPAGPTWTVPAGWKPLPSQEMRFAAFAVSPDRPEAVMTVVPLGGTSGGLPANVNRWESQLGLPPTPADQIGKVVKHEDVKDLHVDWVDLTGPDAGADKPRQRMLAAVVPSGGKTWFFKLVGPADVVEGQKGNFDAFVRSVRFSAAPETASAAAVEKTNPASQPSGAGATASVPTKITWDALPPGWTAGPAAQPPRVATLKIEANGQQGELAVTRFPGNAVGSFGDNVNRWRGQLGLGPAADVSSYVPKVRNLGGEQWAVVDVAGAEQRMLVGMVTPAGGTSGQIWFFKLQGPTKLIEEQQAAFEQFLSSVKFVAE